MNIARICNCVEFPETIVDPDLIKHGEKKRYVPEQRLYLAASAPFSVYARQDEKRVTTIKTGVCVTYF